MTTRRLVLTRSAAVIGAASTGLLLPEIGTPHPLRQELVQALVGASSALEKKLRVKTV